MKKVSLLKPLLLLFALIVGSSSVWADDVSVTLTSAQIKAGTGSSSYGACSATDGNGNTWNAYAIKNQHSAATSDYNFWQIKKYASSTAYYVQVPTLGTKIKSITITVSSTSKQRGAGGNTATLYFSSSNSTSALGTGVASGTGASSITIDCSDLDLNAGYITASGAVRIWDVTVTYSASIVNVTGVSLNKTSLSIPVGESETLTPTVAPAEATNKNVTWSSNKESVATVVDGVVTGVSEGTATITVTTEDGGKTATCDVTVTAAPTAVLTLDFTSNTWGFPEGDTNKTTGTNSYTANGYTITLFGPTGNGYYYDTDANNLLIGKKDATLTLPAFAFNVKRIKVYGTDGASASVTFNVFVGDDAVSTSAKSSKVDHVFDIAADKQAEGTVYVIKVTNGYNMRISKIEVFGTKKVTIASSGYSTLASAYALDFANATPAGLEAYVASSVTASGVDLSAVTEAPASTGVILKGTAGTEYTIPFKASAAAVGTNKLHAAVTAYDCAANEVYILKDGLFHLVTGASTVPAGKAYLLASDVPSGARELTFNFGDETAIRSLTPTLSEGEGVWYDLSGRRVENPTKGIYIMNGKKVIFK